MSRDFGTVLRDIRLAKGMSQEEFASLLGTTKQVISRYENGQRTPKITVAKEYADLLGIPLTILLGEEGATEQSVRPSKRGVKIPVLGRVVAGIPIEAIEEILDYEEISPDMAAHGEYFALQVFGHSMEPKFSEGDVVIVKRQPDVDSGDIAIVLINGDEATIKKVKKLPDGIMLIASNTAVYEPTFYSKKEIDELPVVILGKVVELRAKF